MIGIPIILCGYKKSGTTLLTSLLDSHSQIAVFPEETWYLRQAGNYPDLTVQEGANWLLTISNPRKLALGDSETLLGGNRNYSDFDFQAFRARFMEKLQGCPQTHAWVLRSMVESYAEETGQERKQYWLEKSPLNEHRLDLALSWYPNLRAIYIVRDPRDVFVSRSRKRKMKSNGQRAMPLSKFMRDWAISVWSWQQFMTVSPNGLTIRYEDLARYPKETMAMVCRFLDVSYEPVLETPTKNGKLWSGNSTYGDEFTGVSSKPIGRWRQSLSQERLTLMEAFLGKTMAYFGYQLSTQPPSFFRAMGYWIRHSEIDYRILGVILRLYWPFELPKALKRTTTI